MSSEHGGVHWAAGLIPMFSEDGGVRESYPLGEELVPGGESRLGYVLAGEAQRLDGGQRDSARLPG